MSLIPNQQVNDIAKQITEKVMENLGKNIQAEFNRVQDEFGRVHDEFVKMGKYINSLENRVEHLEKNQTKEGELQGTGKSPTD